MYCLNIQTGGEASIGLVTTDFNKKWARIVVESLYPPEMTLYEYVSLAFCLMERAFPGELHLPTLKAFKSAMWWDEGDRVVLCHPSWQTVDEYMLPRNTGRKARQRRRAARRNAERHAKNAQFEAPA